MLQAEDLKGVVEQKVVKLNGVSAVSCASPEEVERSVRYKRYKSLLRWERKGL